MKFSYKRAADIDSQLPELGLRPASVLWSDEDDADLSVWRTCIIVLMFDTQYGRQFWSHTHPFHGHLSLTTSVSR